MFIGRDGDEGEAQLQAVNTDSDSETVDFNFNFESDVKLVKVHQVAVASPLIQLEPLIGII